MSVAPICTYIGQFFSGTVDPTTPHLVLILLTVCGGLAVGIGIVWEAARAGHLRDAPTVLIIIGVVIEAAATVILFEFDEGISHSQNETIIALETRIAPRHITEEQQAIVAKALRDFPSPEFDLCVTPGVEEDFVTELRETLVAGGWKIRNFGGKLATPEQLFVPEGKIPGIGACGSTGVNIFMDPKLESQFGRSAAVVRLALSKMGISTLAYTMETDEHMRAEIVHVQIGSRL
jgi:hypothetical protein